MEVLGQLKDVPGELHERSWKDFASNRNESLNLATGKTSHVLVIDADDVLELAENFQLPVLTEDVYTLSVIFGERTIARAHVFRPELYRYVGVFHEYLAPVNETPDVSWTIPDRRIPTMRMRIMGGGNRSRDPQRLARDVQTLRRAIEEEPHLARHYTLYLAKTWIEVSRVSGNSKYLAPATEAYEKYVAMGGVEEEEVRASLAQK